MLGSAWRLNMLGEFRLLSRDLEFDRFRTRKTASLLAFLAFHAGRSCAREALAGMIWPDAERELGLKSLGVSLSSLRRILEPPGVPTGSVIVADRVSVRLCKEAVETDVALFQSGLNATEKSSDPHDRCRLLKAALSLYGGELLPHFYDEWIFAEREMIHHRYRASLQDLVRLHEAAGEPDQALPYALREAEADPYDEDIYARLMRLYVAAGHPVDALRQYALLESRLREDLLEQPGTPLKQMAAELRSELADRAPAKRPVGRSDLPVSVRNEPAREQSRGKSPGPPVQLPLTLTRYFGRAAEMDQISRHLKDPGCRLITLTGAGGSGKTRVAIETAKRFAAGFDGRILFVALADISRVGQVAGELCSALQIQQTHAISTEEQLGSALSTGSTLLLLDNLEQLVSPRAHTADAGALARLILTLLARATELKILATSRISLGIDGEQEFFVHPLPTPGDARNPGALPSGQPAEVDALVEHPSVQLFIDRARLRVPDFQLTPRNSECVAEICVLLEGSPLGIELAASWARLLPPAALLARLREGLSDLNSNQGNVAIRHRSLFSAIEWSYSLLSPELQRFLRRVSVFRGGWTTAAAEEVCQEPAAMDRLHALSAHSLIIPDLGGESARYRMLETIRQFAREKLCECGEEETIRRSHFDYCLRLTEPLDTVVFRSVNNSFVNVAFRDYDNLRAALDGIGSSAEETHRGLRLASCMATLWADKGLLVEGRRYLEELLSRPSAGPDSSERARALNGLGLITHWQGDFKATESAHRDALALAQRQGDGREVAVSLHYLGWAAAAQDRLAEALRQFEESLVWQKRAWGEEFEMTLVGVAGTRQLLGDWEGARRLLQEGWARVKETPDTKMQCVWLAYLTFSDCQKGLYDDLAAHLQEWVPRVMELGFTVDSSVTLYCAALLAHHRKQGERAARLIGAASAIRREASLPPIDIPEINAALKTMHDELPVILGSCSYAQLVQEAGEIDPASALSYALTGL